MKRLSVLLAACAGTSQPLDAQPAALAGYVFQAPADWKHVESSGVRSAISTWTPDGESNERKESLVIIRTDLDPAMAKAGLPAIERDVVTAQRGLPQMRPTQGATQIKTAQGLLGMRIAEDFVPAGNDVAYHRVQVTIVDHAAMVHILYTAQRPDYEEAALALVVDSLHRGER